MEQLTWKTLNPSAFILCSAAPPLPPAQPALLPPAQALAFLSSCDSIEAYAEDFIHSAGGGAPDEASMITLKLTNVSLGERVVIADAAAWSVPQLEVSQAAFSHSGFAGTVEELFRKVPTNTSYEQAPATV